MNTKIICNIHRQMENLTQQLLCLGGENDIEILRAEVEDVANELNRLIKEATDAGQSMENRLKEYRNAIERLGFKRNKNEILDYKEKHLKEKIAGLSIELNELKKDNK